MSLTTVPTPGEFSTFVRVPSGLDYIAQHGFSRDTLSAQCLGNTTADVVTLIRQMMSAVGHVFGEHFNELERDAQKVIFNYLCTTDSDHIGVDANLPSGHDDRKDRVTNIDTVMLDIRNIIVSAGIPKILVFVVPYIKGIPVAHIDDICPPCIGAIAHDFPGMPRAMVGSTAVSSDELFQPLTPVTAQALEPGEDIPLSIENPIIATTKFKYGTKVVVPMAILDRKKLLNPDLSDVELLRENIQQQVSGVEFYFTRFLREQQDN